MSDHTLTLAAMDGTTVNVAVRQTTEHADPADLPEPCGSPSPVLDRRFQRPTHDPELPHESYGSEGGVVWGLTWLDPFEDDDTDEDV